MHIFSKKSGGLRPPTRGSAPGPAGGCAPRPLPWLSGSLGGAMRHLARAMQNVTCSLRSHSTPQYFAAGSSPASHPKLAAQKSRMHEQICHFKLWFMDCFAAFLDEFGVDYNRNLYRDKWHLNMPGTKVCNLQQCLQSLYAN